MIDTATTLAPRTTSAFTAAWDRWRAEREQRLRDPHGYLAVTALHWLDDRPRRFSDLPGEWSVTRQGVVVVLAPGEQLRLDRVRLTGRCVLGPVDQEGLRIGCGDLLLEVAQRSGNVFLRPRDPASPLLLAYAGTPTFAPDPDWVRPARYEAYAAPRPTGLDTVVEGMESVVDAVGEVTFEAGGRLQRLIAFDGCEDDLWILFTDETSGVTTYAATRQLSVPLRHGIATSADVDLDFNRAVNMPCAYSDYATCPLPPLGNHVDVLVEAGEQAPGLIVSGV